jgi:hypothetical protein
VLFPRGTPEDWQALTRLFPALGQRYTKWVHQSTLGESLHCLLAIRGAYSRAEGRVAYNSESTREYSVFHGTTLLARTLVYPCGGGDWLYLASTHGDFPYAPPTVFIDFPGMVKGLASDHVSELLCGPCQCTECCLTNRHHPCRFERSVELEYRYPGLVPILQNCNACRERLTQPSFDNGLSMQLRFTGVVRALGDGSMAAETPTVAKRGWLSSEWG